MVALTVIAWGYIFAGAGMAGMTTMGDGMGEMRPETSPGLVVAAMWWVMMVAMMVPSAAPAILLYGRVHRARVDPVAAPPTTAFLFGYLTCWLVFSLLAAGAQLWLERSALASPMTMALRSRDGAAGLLVVAGLYQLSPLKDACLGQCRAPASFLARHYRPGVSGAFRMGVIHGAFCVGCCWSLMLLLFVGGVMNLAWIVALALLVAAEKLLPGGRWIPRITGVALAGWGALLLAS